MKCKKDNFLETFYHIFLSLLVKIDYIFTLFVLKVSSQMPARDQINCFVTNPLNSYRGQKKSATFLFLKLAISNGKLRTVDFSR